MTRYKWDYENILLWRYRGLSKRQKNRILPGRFNSIQVKDNNRDWYKPRVELKGRKSKRGQSKPNKGSNYAR